MKKRLLLLLTISGFYGANAQITITQADIALPGNTMYRGIDTTFTENPIGPAGSNVIWDFSGLLDDQADTVYFVDPATLPNGGQFPSANLGIIITGQGTAYAINDAASLRIIGQEANFQGQNIAASTNPAELITKFPATFISNWTNNPVTASPAIPIAIFPGFDSARVTISKSKNVIVDAWGSLTTPMGTFNVIRQKEDVTTDQDVEAHSSFLGWNSVQNTSEHIISYYYWANGIGFPVMQADSLDDGTVNVTWLIMPPVGIKEATAKQDARVFPNPANESVYIMLDENNGVTIAVYDVQGKLVQQTEAKGAIAQLNTIDLEKGLYTYKVSSSKGLVSTGKFVIAR
ncbi:MAG: hypothetical protein K0S33_413 [Bacteroidetes bacterium]|jgi:hypothetical protein|nr:hypothetical protein [Bacteroidota bacterium]